MDWQFFVNEHDLTGASAVSRVRLMKVKMLACFAGILTASMAWGQAPGKQGDLSLINEVMAIVGDKVITQGDVLSRMPQIVTRNWIAINGQIQNTQELLKAAKAENNTNEVQRLEELLNTQNGNKSLLLEQIIARLKSIMNKHLLVEQVKLDENYREPPGLVDFQLAQQIKEKMRGVQAPKPGDGLAEVLQQQLSRGQTMKDLRRQLLDDWIFGQVNREISQSITISPKQIMDYYRANYGRNENEQHDVVDLYLIRVPRAATGFEEQKANLDKLAASVKSTADFMELVKRLGNPGDGPQGLWREGDGSEAANLAPGAKDPRRMGIAPRTPKLSLPLTLENRGVTAPEISSLLLTKAHLMDTGKAETLVPPGSRVVFLLFVKLKLPKYSVSLEVKRLEIEQLLFQNAMEEAIKRRLALARKLVHVTNYMSTASANRD